MKKLLSILLVVTLFMVLLLSILPGFFVEEVKENGDTARNVEKNIEETQKDIPYQQKEKEIEPSEPPGTIKVHFIDVGQADSILVTTGTSSMLIDGGNNEDGRKVTAYLRAQGVQKLDYLIGTHPHEDHIGGLDEVIRNFEVKKIIMPKIQRNTRTFEDLLVAIKDRKQKVNTAKAGMQWELDAQTKCELLSPLRDTYEDINDYSAVIRMTHGSNVFLFTGDAGTLVEKDMLDKGVPLKADVLKVAHHGSHDATSKAFVEAVSPKYAVISVGQGNDYNHPHEKTLKRLTGVEILRTDQCGTIVITSNGETISVWKEKNQ